MLPRKDFIRKYVFSLDHKVIGKQYYALALVAVFVGMFLSWLMRIHMVWPNGKIPGLELLSKRGRARRGDDSGILSVAADHARYVDGVLRADQRAVRGIWQLLPANTDRRGGHGVSPLQHDVVLDHLYCIHRVDHCVLYSRRSAHRWLDFLRAAERRWQRCWTRNAVGRQFVGTIDRNFLHCFAAGRPQLYRHDA